MDGRPVGSGRTGSSISGAGLGDPTDLECLILRARSTCSIDRRPSLFAKPDWSSAWEAPKTSAEYLRFWTTMHVTNHVQGPPGTVEDRQFWSECGLFVVRRRPLAQHIGEVGRPGDTAIGPGGISEPEPS
jgi:hypothetical protein